MLMNVVELLTAVKLLADNISQHLPSATLMTLPHRHI
jgi:hypothetical protein